MARARICVRLKPGVLDTQGEAIKSALRSLGFQDAAQVRVGKLIEIELTELSDLANTQAILSKMADTLLANPVMENYEVTVD